MSSSTRNILLIVMSIILIGSALYYLSKDYMPKYRWNENYQANNDQPYGLKLIYDILSETRSRNDFLLVDHPPEYFLNSSDTSSLYIFIGAKFITDSARSGKFMDFVKNGNNVFISNINAEHYFFSFFTDDRHPFLRYNYYEDTIVEITFDKPDPVFKFNHKILKELTEYHWAGFDSAFFNDTLTFYGFQRISNINDGLVDCFRIKYGKGQMIFHFNPVLFTNYYMSTRQGLDYVNKLFSQFNKKKIYWDEFSKSPLGADYKDPSHQTPLRFILSERSLRWSWYLLCLFVVMFIVFNAKRKQAYIPLLPSNRNTTLEYINSIATLHHRSNSLVFLADEILKQFYAFVKHRYGISSNMEKKKLIKELFLRSGISEEIIDNLFNRYAGVKYSPVLETKDLVEFYKLTEYFYKNCK